jgi:hypothetical protein
MNGGVRDHFVLQPAQTSVDGFHFGALKSGLQHILVVRFDHCPNCSSGKSLHFSLKSVQANSCGF